MRKSILPYLLFIVALLSSNSSLFAQAGIINTIAGGGTSTLDGVPATAANVDFVWGIVADKLGNYYFSNPGTRKVYQVSSTGIIKTFAGSGTPTYSGDNGPAIAAGINPLGGRYGKGGMAIDNLDNVYFTDFDGRVRKVSPAGIITTVAGNGSLGSSGDGGPATNAQIQTGPLAVDLTGNLYINTGIIRKVNTSGVISHFAVATTWGFSGDGGPATAAEFKNATGMAFDRAGNLYIADSGNGRIRMVDNAGIITTVAGNGAGGSTGDGGLAIRASIDGPCSIGIDSSDNLYILENNKRIRRVNRHGIITTVAGTGISGFSGDGQPAFLARISPQGSASINVVNDILYLADGMNMRVREVKLQPSILSDSFGVDLTTDCSGFQFYLQTKTYQPSYTIKTYYGDGSSDSTSLTNFGSIGYAVIHHSYAASGTYTIKHILRNGTMVYDSLIYPYQYRLCNIIPVKYYYDLDHDCNYIGAVDRFNCYPLLTEVDSNGIVIDTISTLAGYNFTAYGNAGDIFRFKVLSNPPLMPTICPTGSIIADTLRSGINVDSAKFFGFACTPSSSYDLQISANIRATDIRHQSGKIHVRNNSCLPNAATVRLTFSPKYQFASASPTPAYAVGNVVAWTIGFAATPESHNISYLLYNNTTTGLLTVNDTVHSDFEILPNAGDINTANNFYISRDTVLASCDPNEIRVIPEGYIAAGTELEYSIHFENTGTAQAYNIYVMDTLSDFLDISSLRLVMSSHTMNMTKIFDNFAHNILRFDFPDINLPDSSNHDECHGMLRYTIKTKTGLPMGTQIFNQAGIFFDNNPVVMTNTVEDIIHIPASVPDVKYSHGNNAPAVHVFPNPVSDELTIEMEKGAYNSFILFNTIGQQMMQDFINTPQTKVNIKAIPAGLYYISLKGEQGSTVRKFVKL